MSICEPCPKNELGPGPVVGGGSWGKGLIDNLITFWLRRRMIYIYIFFNDKNRFLTVCLRFELFTLQNPSDKIFPKVQVFVRSQTNTTVSSFV